MFQVKTFWSYKLYKWYSLLNLTFLKLRMLISFFKEVLKMNKKIKKNPFIRNDHQLELLMNF